jgi:hypothetical protein
MGLSPWSPDVDAYVVRFQYATLANVITFGDSEMTSLQSFARAFGVKFRLRNFRSDPLQLAQSRQSRYAAKCSHANRLHRSKSASPLRQQDECRAQPARLTYWHLRGMLETVHSRALPRSSKYQAHYLRVGSSGRHPSLADPELRTTNRGLRAEIMDIPASVGALQVRRAAEGQQQETLRLRGSGEVFG